MATISYESELKETNIAGIPHKYEIPKDGDSLFSAIMLGYLQAAIAFDKPEMLTTLRENYAENIFTEIDTNNGPSLYNKEEFNAAIQSIIDSKDKTAKIKKLEELCSVEDKPLTASLAAYLRYSLRQDSEMSQKISEAMQSYPSNENEQEAIEKATSTLGVNISIYDPKEETSQDFISLTPDTPKISLVRSVTENEEKTHFDCGCDTSTDDALTQEIVSSSEDNITSPSAKSASASATTPPPTRNATEFEAIATAVFQETITEFDEKKLVVDNLTATYNNKQKIIQQENNITISGYKTAEENVSALFQFILKKAELSQDDDNTITAWQIDNPAGLTTEASIKNYINAIANEEKQLSLNAVEINGFRFFGIQHSQEATMHRVAPTTTPAPHNGAIITEHDLPAENNEIISQADSEDTATAMEELSSSDDEEASVNELDQTPLYKSWYSSQPSAAFKQLAEKVNQEQETIDRIENPKLLAALYKYAIAQHQYPTAALLLGRKTNLSFGDQRLDNMNGVKPSLLQRVMQGFNRAKNSLINFFSKKPSMLDKTESLKNLPVQKEIASKELISNLLKEAATKAKQRDEEEGKNGVSPDLEEQANGAVEKLLTALAQTKEAKFLTALAEKVIIDKKIDHKNEEAYLFLNLEKLIGNIITINGEKSEDAINKLGFADFRAKLNSATSLGITSVIGQQTSEQVNQQSTAILRWAIENIIATSNSKYKNNEQALVIGKNTLFLLKDSRLFDSIYSDTASEKKSKITRELNAINAKMPTGTSTPTSSTTASEIDALVQEDTTGSSLFAYRGQEIETESPAVSPENRPTVIDAPIPPNNPQLVERILKEEIPGVLVSNFALVVSNLALHDNMLKSKAQETIDEVYSSLVNTTFFADPTLQEESSIKNFLSKVKLSAITYADNPVDENSTVHNFGIKLTGTDNEGSSLDLYIVNRDSNRKELRGPEFLTMLQEEKEKYPNKTLFDVLPHYDLKTFAAAAIRATINLSGGLDDVIGSCNINNEDAKKIRSQLPFIATLTDSITDFIEEKEGECTREEFEAFCSYTLGKSIAAWLVEQNRIDLLPDLAVNIKPIQTPEYYKTLTHLIDLVVATKKPRQETWPIVDKIICPKRKSAVPTKEEENIQQILRIYHHVATHKDRHNYTVLKNSIADTLKEDPVDQTACKNLFNQLRTIMDVPKKNPDNYLNMLLRIFGKQLGVNGVTKRQTTLNRWKLPSSFTPSVVSSISPTNNATGTTNPELSDNATTSSEGSNNSTLAQENYFDQLNEIADDASSVSDGEDELTTHLLVENDSLTNEVPELKTDSRRHSISSSVNQGLFGSTAETSSLFDDPSPVEKRMERVEGKVNEIQEAVKTLEILFVALFTEDVNKIKNLIMPLLNERTYSITQRGDSMLSLNSAVSEEDGENTQNNAGPSITPQAGRGS